MRLTDGVEELEAGAELTDLVPCEGVRLFAGQAVRATSGTEGALYVWGQDDESGCLVRAEVQDPETPGRRWIGRIINGHTLEPLRFRWS